MSGTIDEGAAKRAAEGVRLYVVLLEPREGAGDRSPYRDAHLAYIHELERQGRMFASGPLVDDATGQSLGRSIFILRGKSAAEVEALIGEEPFVRHGFRTFKVHAWRLADGEVLGAALAGG